MDIALEGRPIGDPLPATLSHGPAGSAQSIGHGWFCVTGERSTGRPATGYWTGVELFGVFPSGAPRLLGDVGDISRFTTKARFASERHRPTRRLQRRAEPAPALPSREPAHHRVLHMMALTAVRQGGEGRAYYDRKRATRKTK